MVRRWFQFSLRTILIAISLLAIPLGWFAYKVEQARKQQVAVKSIQEHGGTVQYTYEMSKDGFVLMLAPPPGPAWLRDIFGIDFVANVGSVDLPRKSVPETPASPAPRIPFRPGYEAPRSDDATPEEIRATETCLQQLAQFPHLRNLYALEAAISDEQLKYLEGVTSLEKIWLNDTPIGDGGLEHINKLPRLEYLILGPSAVTDAGLKQLEGMQQLRALDLIGSKVTPSAGAKLQKSLPNCKITF